MYSSGPRHMDKQRLDDQLEPIHNSSVPTQDVTWKISQEQWTIEMGGKRGSGRSMLAPRHDDDINYLPDIIHQAECLIFSIVNNVYNHIFTIDDIYILKELFYDNTES